METADGEWRVEVYRQPQTRAYWYRLIHGENTVEGLTIAGVQRLLAEAGYDLADLIDGAA
jgi:bifunctional non-homologous end joining protein LigD